MKKVRRTILLLTCLVLLASLPIAAFATSKQLFSRSIDGYRVTGSSSIYDTGASSTIRATEDTSGAIRGDDYTYVFVAVSCYGTNGVFLCGSANTGSRETTASCTKANVVRTTSQFTFNTSISTNELGYFTLYK